MPLLLLLLLSWVVAVAPIQAGETGRLSEQAARQRLAEAGLSNEGFLWLLPAEERLVRQLDSLDRLAREVRNAEKRVDALIEQNESRRRELLQTEQLLRQLEAAVNDPRPTAEQKAQLKQRIEVVKARRAQLRQLYLPSEKFAEHHQVRHEVIRWINARNELGLLIRLLPEARFELQAAYEQLERQPVIVAALAAAGEQHRLGSGRDYDRRLSRLHEFEPLAFSQVVPLYIAAGRPRVSALVNERAVATFTWEEASGPTLLPESLLARAGATDLAAAPVEQLRYGGRTLRGRAVTVAYLRLGDRVASDVSVLALPPEHEDVGCVLRTGSISNFLSKPNFDKVRLEFER
ncbi:MAG: hypothetical protein WD030_01475 [Pirellulales bacterium]